MFKLFLVTIVSFLLFNSACFSQSASKKLIPYKIIKAKKPTATKAGFQYNFDFYDIDKGLNNSIIYSITEAKNGYLWIGTDGGGINIYNGKSFEYITEKDGLISNIIFDIFEDSKGRIWIGTQGGITYYDGKTFKTFPEDRFPPIEINTIYEDNFNNIWIGTYGGGVFQYNDSVFTQYTTNNGLSSNYVTSVFQNSKNEIWIGTYGGGLNTYINGKFSFHSESFNEATAYINSICEDNNGVLWIGTDGGGILKIKNNTIKHITDKEGLCSIDIKIILNDNKGNIWIGTNDGITKVYNNEYSTITEKEGLNNNRIWAIEQDRNGNLWFGSYGNGIIKFSGETFIHFSEEGGLANEKVDAILEDSKNNIWFGTSGGGVVKLKNNTFYNYTEKHGLSNNSVKSILEDDEGKLWFGTYGGGITIYDGNYFKQYTMKCGLPSNDIMIIKKDNNNNKWLGSYGGGLSKITPDYQITNYNTDNGLPSLYINDILEDENGNIWIATYGGGISKFNGKNFTNYTTKQGLASNDPISLNIDKNNNLWIGTFSGLSVFVNGKFINVTENEGLSNNSIVSILIDHKENVWLGTLTGINKLIPITINNKQQIIAIDKNYALKKYGVLEGFKGNDCNSKAVFEDKNGNIWWGTSKKLTKYNPKLDIPDNKESIIQITNIKLFFEEIDWLNFDTTYALVGKSEQQTDIRHSTIKFDSITSWNNLPINLILPYHQNHLTFNFIGINLTQPEKVRCRFMLEGLESAWNPITDRTEATYSNLPPGTFTFKVISMNPEGVWNKKPAQFSFEITPPWWATWWFRISAIIFSILSLYGIFKWRVRALKMRQKELERIVKERTAEVVRQKDEIELQRDQISEQKEQITDSIQYASRIQSAVMPSREFIEKILPNYFIYFKPRDIVSGDFYWIGEKENKIIVVAADCTGHGVPGAFMSMLGVSFLNEIINKSEVTQANLILNQLREYVKSTLGQEEETDEIKAKDGMDIAICVFDFQSDMLQYAGAYNPLYMVRNNELIETKADKMPIGIYINEKSTFTNHEIEFKKGDKFYIFSDGYIDQFGGEKGFKFMSKPFKRLLVEMCDKNMKEQYNILDKKHQEWVNNINPNTKLSYEQIDDILVIGIQV